MKGNGNEIIDVDACSDEIPGEVGRAVDTHPTIIRVMEKLYVHINIRKKWTFKINYNFIFYIK